MPVATGRLGLRYAKGDGVPHDLPRAIEWCRKAAEAGFVPAMVNLAFAYQQGAGVSKDDKGARRWLKAAAEKGDAYAKKWPAGHLE